MSLVTHCNGYEHHVSCRNLGHTLPSRDGWPNYGHSDRQTILLRKKVYHKK